MSDDAGRLAAHLSRVFGPATVALIHYGSHAQGSGAAPESAHDFFVVLDDYGAGYRALVEALHPGYSAATAARLNRMLPPNVISIRLPDRPELSAKCAVLSLADLARGCSGRAPDLWCLGRLFQEVQIAWSRDPKAREAVTRCVVDARLTTFDWGRPYLPASFGAEDVARTLLRTAYGAEIRPERGERIESLIDAQRTTLIPIFETLLETLAQTGVVERILCKPVIMDTAGNPEATAATARSRPAPPAPSSEPIRYRDTHPPGPWARSRARAFLFSSKIRATLRWIKYVVLYEDWLDYVVHKVERRRGVTVELTDRERRWPLIFLWPKAIRILGRRGEPRGRA